MNAGNNVVYEGPKFFWRAKCTVDVVIAEHEVSNVVEVICSESTTKQIADRLYLDRLGTIDKLDPNELSDRLHMVKEMALRRRNTFDEPSARASILREVLSEYILDRLVVLEFSPQLLVLTFQDKEDAADLICNKPTNFTPARTPKEFHPLKPGEVKNALHRLKTEREALQKVCANAAMMERKVRRLSFRKERWRMPMVVLKVARGQKLTETDAVLWETIAMNDQAHFADDSLTDETSGSGTSSAHKVVTVYIDPKGSRWDDKAVKPKVQRKSSFTVGIAALQSSLRRTLHSFSAGSGLTSSGAAAQQQETAQHMRAAVGGDFDCEQPHVVLTKPAAEVTAEPLSFVELVQNLLKKYPPAGSAAAVMEVSKDAASTHKVTPLSRSQSAPPAATRPHSHHGNHHVHAHPPPHAHAKAPRRHSHWTGQRAHNSPTHNDPTAQQLQARRILERLRRSDSATVTTSPAAGTSPVHNADGAFDTTPSPLFHDGGTQETSRGHEILVEDTNCAGGEDDAQLSAQATLQSKAKPTPNVHF